MVEIIVSAYLVIGGLAAGVIWAALIASKRRNDKVAKANYGHFAFWRVSKRQVIQNQSSEKSISGTGVLPIVAGRNNRQIIEGFQPTTADNKKSNGIF